MANSVNKNTQNVRKTSTTGKTGAAAKGSANPKKSKRQMKKQARRTIAGLLLASAVVVAAIPTPDVRAFDVDGQKEKIKIGVYNKHLEGTPYEGTPNTYVSTVPFVADAAEDEKTIYTSGDGMYKFAYLRPTAGASKCAVILDFTNTSQSKDIVIPSELQAYKQIADNYGGIPKYNCLVSKADEFLYYEVKVNRLDEDDYRLYQVVNYVDPEDNQPKTLEVNEMANGVIRNDVGEPYLYRVKIGEKIEKEGDEPTPIYKDYDLLALMDKGYEPCTYDNIEKWENLADSELFYQENTADKTIKPCDDSAHYRIVAPVKYIGSETIKAKEGTEGGWEVAGVVKIGEEGVFATESISTLSFPDSLCGIGDFAFYKCGDLQAANLGNFIETIGNAAFAGCYNLNDFSIGGGSVRALGKDCFYDCRNLRTFRVPTMIEALGDCCFENDYRLETIDMGGVYNSESDSIDYHTIGLSKLGVHMFRGCTALSEVILPEDYQEDDLEIDTFEGCTSLQRIVASNSKVKLVETHSEDDTNYPRCSFTWESFKAQIPDSFYLEGRDKSEIHENAKDAKIAFRYFEEDLYELIVIEKDENDDDVEVTYQVNKNNELVKFWTDGKPDSVTIPETIGPYGISAINAGSFNGQCNLKKITIPASVTSIGDNAFKGCHNLTSVIFTDASTIASIGTDAFKTQDTDSSCPHRLPNPPDKLYFIGKMVDDNFNDTVPFTYAMNGVSNFNNADQEKSFITCHSGWPTNLEVRYVYDPITSSGRSELVGYIRYDTLREIKSAYPNPPTKEIKDAGGNVIGYELNDSTTYEWLKDTFPYVTLDNALYYYDVLKNSVAYYEATPEERQHMKQPSENEMAVVNSSLNITIPKAVNLIQDGLFSGYTYDDSVSPLNREAYKEVDQDGKIVADGDGIGPDKYLNTVLMNGVDLVDPFTFKDCEKLQSVDFNGPVYLDDYCMDNCDSLDTVFLGSNLKDTGKRPFADCEALRNVNCSDANPFEYRDGIIYRNTDEGLELVECLEARGKNIGSYTVGPNELSSVSVLKEEAFDDCDEIGQVDFSLSPVMTISDNCFADCDQLTSVKLGDDVKSIESGAFKDCPRLRLLTIPGVQSYIAQDAFMNGDWVKKPADRQTDPKTPESANQQMITFECVKGTTSDKYAGEYWYINPEYGKVTIKHEVRFWCGYCDAFIERQNVSDGEDAVPPTPHDHSDEGFAFVNWDPNYTNIVKESDIRARYSDKITHTVWFQYLDMSTFEIVKLTEDQVVAHGTTAKPPTTNPYNEGYKFVGWTPDYRNIYDDGAINAIFESATDDDRKTVWFYAYDGQLVASYKVDVGGSVVAPAGPSRDGYTFVGWVPNKFTDIQDDVTSVATYEKIVPPGPVPQPTSSGSPSPSSSSSASPSPSPTDGKNDNNGEATKYTVTVSGGSGSGSYPAGAIVGINAYDMGTGQTFDKWTTSTAGVGFADATSTSTFFTMPAANVAITATYKTGGADNNNQGGNNNGGNGNGGNNGNTSNPSGTRVDINKNGISNKGVAGATVSGSTDNFVVKITDDASAAQLAQTALQNAFGANFADIKYFPFDISLYDESGTTKIADTSGMSVNITMPLPDELATYAGNNKVASVLGGELEPLNSRFTTVDGVPCISFTATHFSPYVIYVDTKNLTESTIDYTPKTGDPIHPKWFLAIGLAAISLILFFKKDKRVPLKAA